MAQTTLKLRYGSQESELVTIPQSIKELAAAVGTNFRIYSYKLQVNGTQLRDDQSLMRAYINSRDDVLFIDVIEDNPSMEHMDESVQDLYMDMLNKFKIQDQPEASSQIQLEANGLVKKDDLIMIIRDLAQSAKERLLESSQKFLEKRQEYYGIDEANWRAVAMEQLQFQEMLLNTITNEVCQKYGISLQQFEMSNMSNAGDPEVRTALQEMALSTLQGDGRVPDSLTREKLREILEYTCDFIESYIKDNSANLTPADIILLKIREGDEVMKQFGYNENEISAALSVYNIDTDPYWQDIRQRLDQVMSGAFGMNPGMMAGRQ